MPSLKTHSVFQSQASQESSNEDRRHVTGQLLLVPLSWGVSGLDMKCRLCKNRDLSGSAGRGCSLTTDSQYDREVSTGVTPGTKMQRGGRGGS